MKSYGFGIVGCGSVALKHIEAISATENAKLVAVADTLIERARACAEKYKGDRVRTYSDYRDLLEEKDIGIVNVCTPPVTHAEIGTATMETGRHIIVEKPISLSLEDADKLIGSCRKNRVKLCVVYQNRFNPQIIKLREAIEQKRFGKLIMGVSTMRWNRGQDYYNQTEWYKGLGGGSLMGQGIHNVDLLQWMMGPVKSVFAYGGTFRHDIETEDATTAIVRFKDNAIGIIETSTCVYPQNLEETLFISGENGTVLIGGTAINRIDAWSFKGGFVNERMMIESLLKEASIKRRLGHSGMINNMLYAIDNDVEPLVPGEEGKKSLEIALAIYKSMNTRKEVVL